MHVTRDAGGVAAASAAAFGEAGRLTMEFGGNDRGFALAIQADGKIVAAGVAADQDFAIVRLALNGRSDATFGGSGVVVTDFSGSNDGAYARGATSADFALVRYHAER
jgi:beta-propeller uncharacterized protein DUF5122